MDGEGDRPRGGLKQTRGLLWPNDSEGRVSETGVHAVWFVAIGVGDPRPRERKDVPQKKNPALGPGREGDPLWGRPFFQVSVVTGTRGWAAPAWTFGGSG